MLRGYGGKKNRKRRRKKSCNTKWGIWNAKSFPSIRQILWSANGRHFFAPKNFCSRALEFQSSLSHFFSCVGKTFFCSIPMRIFQPFLSFPIWNSSISFSIAAVTISQCVKITTNVSLFAKLPSELLSEFPLLYLPFGKKSNETFLLIFKHRVLLWFL